MSSPLPRVQGPHTLLTSTTSCSSRCLSGQWLPELCSSSSVQAVQLPPASCWGGKDAHAQAGRLAGLSAAQKLRMGPTGPEGSETDALLDGTQSDCSPLEFRVEVGARVAGQGLPWSSALGVGGRPRPGVASCGNGSARCPLRNRPVAPQPPSRGAAACPGSGCWR